MRRSSRAGSSWHSSAQELPDALAKIREGGVGPVDMAQASIGPGMGVFTEASRVLEPDDSTMTVRTAIALINQVRDEITGEEAAGYDSGYPLLHRVVRSVRRRHRHVRRGDLHGTGPTGSALTTSTTPVCSVPEGGKARLLLRDELPTDWDPASDSRLTAWECAQHLVRVLEASDGGLEAAARLYERMPPEQGEAARLLAYRLYDICERSGRATEAQAWNMLVSEWVAMEEASGAS